MDDPRNVFREEADELLAVLETSLLELEDNAEDHELIGRIFRAMHTIKGSGAMFGFDEIAAFTHEVESTYDLVREGKLPVSSELVNLSLAARDRIRAMLEAAFTGGEVDPRENARIISELVRLRGDPAGTGPTAVIAAPDPDRAEQNAAPVAYRIHFAPHPEFFSNGSNPLPLLDELRGMGECSVVAHPESVPDLAAIEPANCYFSWDIVLETDQEENAIRDVFIFVEDICRLRIERLAPAPALAREEGPRQAQEQVGKAPRPQSEPAPSIRVDAARLDGLVNLVGELVTVQARLSRQASRHPESELAGIAEELERLTAELRDNVMGIRMMPIGAIFSKFRRLVRDLSRELGKEVRMTTQGEETELDKTVIEKLNDPFVHLIRNSIDHGIEAPAVREGQGKPRQGTVHLSAVHSGDSVFIEVRDDGAGLDRDVLRRKAIEKGLLAADEERSDQEIYQLLFLPGFSTANQVSSVSGRGVGMDVVKRGIEALRGSIAIDTDPGQGTLIRIRLPLTLAIIESLLVAIGREHFVLPLGLVEECIEMDRATLQKNQGRSLVNVRGHLVPYIQLRQHFGINEPPPPLEQIVITRVNGEQIGLVVDHVVGEHQTVIKSLGPLYRDVRGISGATILGDGSMALIMDIPQLAGVQ